MSDEKLDWFPLYWQRFTIGTLQMNAEELGAYMLLLIHQWDKGFVPENEKDLKKISRISIKKLDNVLIKFEKIGEKYYNNTLEIIRIEQHEKNEKNSEKGKKGAKVRWDNQRAAITQALLKQSQDDSTREEENRKEKKREEENLGESAEAVLIDLEDQEELLIYPTFKDFWNEYDKKVGDQEKIKKKWEKLSQAEKLNVMDYIPNYKSCEPDKKFRKNPDTFFNNKSWNDELIFKDGRAKTGNSQNNRDLKSAFSKVDKMFSDKEQPGI